MGSPLTAGWYDDEADLAFARWHDGVAWTGHMIVKAEWIGRVVPPPTAYAPAPSRVLRCRWCNQPLGAQQQLFCVDCSAAQDPDISLPAPDSESDVLRRWILRAVAGSLVFFALEIVVFDIRTNVVEWLAISGAVGTFGGWYLRVISRALDEFSRWVDSFRRR
jgi:hypothetical protein